MIIECPCKKKKFNIDVNLIPTEGRNLQCGACDRVWFYKMQDPIPKHQEINEDITNKENEDSDENNDNKFNKQVINQLFEENKKDKSELSGVKETKSNLKR